MLTLVNIIELHAGKFFMIFCHLILTEKDCLEWNVTTVDPQEKNTWRSGVRSAMHAASQLPGKGPTDVDDASAAAC